ncbi:MAG: ABC transporter ATP-binding protein [Myxococcales bacterium]|nr:ABC transporter ATP-binding protein [Myxococcales bacterium]
MSLTTPTPEPTPPHLDRELRLLLALADQAGGDVRLADHQAAAALADARRVHPTPEAWAERARHAGARLDLRIVARSLSARELLAAGGRQGPLAALLRVDGRATLATIDGWRGRWARVALEGEGEADDPTWLGDQALADRLGVDVDAPVTWLLAVPTRAPGLAAELGEARPGPAGRLRALLRLEAADLWVIVTYAVGVGVFTLATPIAVQALVNTVAFGALLQPLVVLSILLLGGLAFAGALRAMQAWVVEALQQRWMIQVIGDLAHRLPRLRALAGRDHGPELVNRFFDVVTVQKAASSLLLDGLSVALQAAIGMLVLAFYHPLLFAFDVVLLAAVAGIVLGLGKPASATAIKESKAKYAIAAWLEELARHPRLFKGRGGPELAAARADELARAYLGARRGHFRLLFRQIVGVLALQAIASAALLGLGGWLVIARQLTLGQLVAAELIVSAVVAAFAKLGKHLETYYDLLAAIDKLGALADLPLERGDGEHLPAPARPAALRLRGVALASAGGAPILEGLDLELRAGEALAIVGRAGSGKSTLAALLDGLRAPTRGSALLDGVDLRDRALDDLRGAVAVVGGLELFAGSLAANVGLGQPTVTRAELREVLIAVGLEPLLRRLGDDLDAPIGTLGEGLSEAEARRLVLARAIVARPRLLVLDGLLDALDPASREALVPALRPEDAPWSLLVLTRDPTIARLCDRALALEGGALHPLTAPLGRPYTR